jgi:endonuclease III
MTETVVEHPDFTLTIARLKKFYGVPKPPKITDPFEQVLWENVAYLADDEKRARAFAALEKTVGTTPEDILRAKPEKLLAVTRIGGIVPELRAQRLRQCAEIVQILLKEKLDSALSESLAHAKKTLKRFPTIGEPGAEKILMMAGKYPVFGIESNGLRVLLRLGFAQEQKSYSASYRSVQRALAGQLPAHCKSLVTAHQLLRTHGQQLCKRSRPLCGNCPLEDICYFRARQT